MRNTAQAFTTLDRETLAEAIWKRGAIVIETVLFATIGTAVLGGAPQDRRTDYVERLQETPATAEAQFRLATWARKEGLKEEAEGHLRAAVHLDPEYVGAHKALGRTLKDGLWETKSEREKRLDDEKRFASDRKEWSRRLREVGIAQAVASRTLDEAAAAAIETYAAGDKKRTLDAVSAFRESPHGAASMALVRLAVASQLEDVRREAVKGLADKSPDHYLPPLVEFVRPIESRITVVLGVGEVWSWQDSERLYVSLPPTSLAQGLSGPRMEAVNLHDEAAQRHAEAGVQRKHAVVALQQLTGAKIGEDFMAWRQVAMRITNGGIPLQRGRAKKTITSRYEPDVVRIGSGLMPIAPLNAPENAASTQTSSGPPTTIGTPWVPPTRPWNGRAMQLARPVGHWTRCFAAGTPVTTKRGLVPIDEVCVGELVLSRDVATGETGFKPVLARTLLPATDMRRIRLGDDSVLSTMAHPFWSPTLGWKKAMEMSHGTPVAAKGGVVAVGRNEAAEPSQAYNLVVADWNTYFVGKSQVLVHDNSPIRDVPTLKR